MHCSTGMCVQNVTSDKTKQDLCGKGNKAPTDFWTTLVTSIEIPPNNLYRLL